MSFQTKQKKSIRIWKYKRISKKLKFWGVNYIFKILYIYIVLPCLFQSLAVPLVLGRGPNEKSE